MTAILKKAISLYGQPVKTDNVTTCNAWGFGGWYGKRYTFANGYTLEIGRFSTRHMGTFPREPFLYNETGEAIDFPLADAATNNKIRKLLTPNG